MLTTINSQVIPLRKWQTQNQQLKELEEYLSRQQLINLGRVDLEKQ